jgi:hypothetical protein
MPGQSNSHGLAEIRVLADSRTAITGADFAPESSWGAAAFPSFETMAFSGEPNGLMATLVRYSLALMMCSTPLRCASDAAALEDNNCARVHNNDND